tara:strand:- start:2994 stop:3266 length:273 start_codon:yes stop_codon:yes gene_type:complete
MILLVSETDFINFDNNDKNKITNYYNLKDENITRPTYEPYNDDSEISFIVKDFLNPSVLDLEPVYKKNVKIKGIKPLHDNVYQILLNPKK